YGQDAVGGGFPLKRAVRPEDAHRRTPGRAAGGLRVRRAEAIELGGLALRQQRNTAAEGQGDGHGGAQPQEGSGATHGFTFRSSEGGFASVPCGLASISSTSRCSAWAAVRIWITAAVICGRPLLAKSVVGPCSLSIRACAWAAVSLASWAASAMLFRLRRPSVSSMFWLVEARSVIFWVATSMS